MCFACRFSFNRRRSKSATFHTVTMLRTIFVVFRLHATVHQLKRHCCINGWRMEFSVKGHTRMQSKWKHSSSLSLQRQRANDFNGKSLTQHCKMHFQSQSHSNAHAIEIIFEKLQSTKENVACMSSDLKQKQRCKKEKQTKRIHSIYFNGMIACLPGVLSTEHSRINSLPASPTFA